MVRTYWFVSGFNEASDNLDLQPLARIDHVEACRPRAEMHLKVYASRTRGTNERAQMTEKTYDAVILGAGPCGRGRWPEGWRKRAGRSRSWRKT